MNKHVATHAEINAFYKGIKSIEHKNNGGCLLFCYAFYLWLEKNGYDDSSFSIIDYNAPYEDEDSIAENEAYVKGTNKKAAAATHFTWVYAGQEYDSMGVVLASFKPSDWRHHQFDELMKKHMVEKFCTNALRNGSWNEMFDRKSAIKTLKQKLDIDIPTSIGLHIDPNTGYVVIKKGE